MEKVINILLVVVIALILKNMYLPKKDKTWSAHDKRVRNQVEKENSEKIFSKDNVNFKNLIMPKKGNNTQVLPVGTLEVVTKDETSYVPVTFDKHGRFKIGSAKDCDLVLQSPYIGSYHCSIEYDNVNDEIVLFDNDSKNGIYDNHKNRVSEIVMEKGKDFYLAKCIRLRWNDFNAFVQVDEDDLPVLGNKDVKKDEATTKTMPQIG